MPFNGLGTFTPVYNWQQDAANGLNISSSRMETQDIDIASGLTNCLTRDGQGIPTAHIAWGGFNLTGVGAFSTVTLTTSGAASVGGTLTVTGALSGAGAAFSSGITGTTASFSGSVSTGTLAAGGSISRDANFYLEIGSGNAIINVDSNDSFYFTRAANNFNFLIGGSVVATVDASKINANGLQVGGNAVWHAGNFAPTNYALLSGANFTSLQVGGNAVWHAGNLTPSNYALLSGATFTGAIKRDANLYLDLSGGNPVINVDSNDWISYDRTANKYYFNIGGTAVASIDASGNLRVKGNVLASQASV